MEAKEDVRELSVNTDNTTFKEAVRVGVHISNIPVVGDDGSLGDGGSQGKNSKTLDGGKHGYVGRRRRRRGREKRESGLDD